MGNLTRELEALINKHSIENESDTPGFLLATYLSDCLKTWAKAVKARDAWYSFQPFDDRDSLGGGVPRLPGDPLSGLEAYIRAGMPLSGHSHLNNGLKSFETTCICGKVWHIEYDESDFPEVKRDAMLRVDAVATAHRQTDCPGKRPGQE